VRALTRAARRSPYFDPFSEITTRRSIKGNYVRRIEPRVSGVPTPLLVVALMVSAECVL
jgi:hypothetical protein